MKHPAVNQLAERFPRGWVEPKVIADELGVHHQTVLGWINSGDLPAVGIGSGGRGPYRVFLVELDAFFVRRSTRAPVENVPQLTPAAADPAAPTRTSRRKRRNTGLVAA